MKGEVIHVLEDLIAKSREILACPEPDAAAWHHYRAGREAIFAYLSESSFPVAQEERTAARRLIEEIAHQDRRLRAKIQKKLRVLRAEMVGLKRGRRAIRSYHPSQSFLLLERSV